MYILVAFFKFIFFLPKFAIDCVVGLYKNEETRGMSFLVLLVFVLPLVMPTWSIIHNIKAFSKRKKYKKNIQKIHRDMTYQEVVALLGEPLDLQEFDDDKVYYVWAQLTTVYFQTHYHNGANFSSFGKTNTNNQVPIYVPTKEINGIRIGFRDDKIVAIQYLKI